MRDFYDTKHWEDLVNTIIDRIGVERFFETVSYVLEQRGCENITIATELLRRAALEVDNDD